MMVYGLFPAISLSVQLCGHLKTPLLFYKGWPKAGVVT